MERNMTPLAMAARQLVVPFMTESIEHPFTFEPGPVVLSTSIPTVAMSTTDRPFTLGPGPVSVPAPTPTGRPFTLGHGPVQSWERTAATSSLAEEYPFTTQHGPGPVVVVSTSVLTPTFVTLMRKSPTTDIASLPEDGSVPNGDGGSQTGRFGSALDWVKEFPGWDHNHNNSESAVKTTPDSSEHVITDCHPDSSDYIYFTVLSPDGSLLRDARGEKALYHIRTSWSITYPGILQKALFNDPDSYPGCRNGHCLSTVIPGTDLRIARVKNPRIFRAGSQNEYCGYMDDLSKINKLSVQLGAFGYLKDGAQPLIPVLDFVEEQMLTKYPGLEIGMICGFTVGLPAGCYFAYWLFMSIFYICTALRIIGRAASQQVRKCATKLQTACRNGPDKHDEAAQTDGLVDPYSLLPVHHTRRSATTIGTPPPAAYTLWSSLDLQ